jgi:hypothetical protein
MEAGDFRDLLFIGGIALRAAAAVDVRVYVPGDKPAVGELDHVVSVANRRGLRGRSH